MSTGPSQVNIVGLLHQILRRVRRIFGHFSDDRILQQFRGRPIGDNCCSRSKSEHPLNQNFASAAISWVQRQHSISLRSIGIVAQFQLTRGAGGGGTPVSIATPRRR